MPDKRKSNLFVNFTFSIVEHLQARLMNWLFSTSPPVKIMPYQAYYSAQDVQDSKVYNALVQYDLRMNNQYMLYLSWIKEDLMYGTSIVKASWDSEKNRSHLQHIDIKNFYVDPKGDYFNYDWCFHRVIKRIDEIEKLAKEGIYDKAAVQDLKSEWNVETRKNERLKLIGTTGSEYTDEELENAVECLEYWDNDLNRCIIANRKVIITPKKRRKNPFHHEQKPFVPIFDFIFPHEFYGAGEIEYLEELQHELNSKRNQRMDIVNLVINPVLKLIRGQNVNRDQLRNLQPGAVVEMNTPEALQPLNLPGPNTAAYQEEAMIKNDMRLLSGLAEPAQGVPMGRRTTASEVTSLQEMANHLFQEKLRIIIENGMVRLTDLILQLNQQYMGAGRIVPIIGENQKWKYRRISKQEITGKYDLIAETPLVKPEVSKQVDRRQLVELMGITGNLLQTNPQLQPVMMKLYAKIVEAFGYKDIEVEPPQQAGMGQMSGIPNGIPAQGPIVPGAPPMPGGQPPMRGPEQMTQGSMMRREMGGR